jgi:hypothetical protein
MHKIEHTFNNNFLLTVVFVYRCEVYDEYQLSNVQLDIKKDQQVDLYTIQNFEELLSHYDDLLAVRLNNEYREAELTFIKVKHSSKALPKDLPPVDPEKRKKQVILFYFYLCYTLISINGLGKLRFKNIGFFFNFNFFLGQNDISF